MPRSIFQYERAHACWNLKTVLEHMPPAYKAFYKEWRLDQPEAVHYIAEQGNWKKNAVTGEIQRVNSPPIPLRYPREVNKGLWGGETVIKGYQYRSRNANMIPHWWVPRLQRTVLYTEVLDKQLELLVTQRALQLVHKHHGLDSYLLETRACDIVSLLGLKIKQAILLQLVRGTLRPDNMQKRQELLQKYSQYIIPEEDAEWYGLSVGEAFRKMRLAELAKPLPPPLKHRCRAELMEKLRKLQSEQQAAATSGSDSCSWLSKVNPFASSKNHQRRDNTSQDGV